MRTLPLLVALPLLPGCWSAPITKLPPNDAARPEHGRIDVVVKLVRPSVIVGAVDLGARTITLADGETAEPVSYHVGTKVANLDHFKVGDRVRTTVTEELTIHLSRGAQGQIAAPAADPIRSDAQVLSIDRSYRLLMVHFRDGHDETFKVGLRVGLEKIDAGDAVTVQPLEAIALRSR